MNVDQFNTTHARHKLQADPLSEVRVLRKDASEWLLEIDGKSVWAQVKKKNKKRRDWDEVYPKPSYSLSKDEIALGPGPFMLLQWIRSLDTPEFCTSYAARELGLSVRSTRLYLNILRQSGMLDRKVEH